MDKTIISLENLTDFLSKLAEKSESVYWLSSPDFSRIAYISPAYEKIWGRSREILYKNPEVWIDYLVKGDVKDRHPIKEMAEKIKVMGVNARFDESYRIKRPNGEIRWIIDRGFPVFGDDGICYGVTGVAIDVTDELVEELQLAKEKAELANQLKRDFIQNMEHDIRTPVAGIYSILESFSSSETDPEKKEILTLTFNAAKELLDYCNGILDFSKLEAGLIPVVSKKFDLKRLINGIIAIETPPATIRNLQLSVEYSKDVPNIVVGDQQRLQRILINLISNGIKFTKEGFIKVAITTAKKENKNVILQIAIQDSGIGMPEEKQNIIYEKFSRLHPSNRGIYKGSGLGLPTVKQLVEELDGEIDLESKPGKGTTFVLTLPFKLPLLDEIFLDKE
jgi:PAS domain S-box-containing protein